MDIESGCIDIGSLIAKLDNCFVVFVYYISKIINHKAHKGNTKAHKEKEVKFYSRNMIVLLYLYI